MNLLNLYDIAEKNNITIDFFDTKEIKAFSIPGAIVLNADKHQTQCEIKTSLAHELGHHMKNAFYNITSTFETRGRQEERAKRWAVENVITYDKLNEAIKIGIREIWELADYFNVTEDFIRDAVGVFKLQGYEI